MTMPTEEERNEAAELRDLAIDTATESEFYTPADVSRRLAPERSYILPFGREYGRWNPYDVENASFGKKWLDGMYGIICFREDERRTRPSRLIFSHGSPLPYADPKTGELRGMNDLIWQRFLARHDQTGARLGEYVIVGLIMYGQDGNVLRAVGDVPDAKLSQNTYK